MKNVLLNGLLSSVAMLCCVTGAHAQLQPSLYAMSDQRQVFLVTVNPDTTTLVRTLPSTYSNTTSLVAADGYFFASYGAGKIVRFGFTTNDETDLGDSGVYKVSDLAKSPDGTVYALVSKDNDGSLTTESLGVLNTSTGDISIIAGPFEVSPQASDRFTRNLTSITVDQYGKMYTGISGYIRTTTFTPGGDMAFTSLFAYPGSPPSSAINHPALTYRSNNSFATTVLNAIDKVPLSSLIFYTTASAGFTLDMAFGGGEPYNVVGLARAIRCSDVDTTVKIQNQTISAGGDYFAESTIEAGHAVDGSVPTGDVDIDTGADIVTFHAGSSITLAPGFSVQPGSTFRATVESGLCI